MTKNIITISNLTERSRSKIVENFSDENVKTAIAELIHIPTKGLKCVSASVVSSIYQVDELVANIHGEINRAETDTFGEGQFLIILYSNLF